MHGQDNIEKYGANTDEEIVRLIHNGDKEAQDFLIDKYKRLVRVKSRLYFIIGADREDIIQEGMIGLYKAIRDFNPEKQTLFYAFAELCITRQMLTAIKAATRQKHMPLNSYVSLNKAVFEDDTERTYLDTLVESHMVSPEDLLIGREEKRNIENHMSRVLSDLETKVLSLYLQGNSYTEIGQAVSKDEKSIDNALQRARRKVEKILRIK